MGTRACACILQHAQYRLSGGRGWGVVELQWGVGRGPHTRVRVRAPPLYIPTTQHGEAAVDDKDMYMVGRPMYARTSSFSCVRYSASLPNATLVMDLLRGAQQDAGAFTGAFAVIVRLY
jgi:hypothetical protein